jgi:hypothetical protein
MLFAIALALSANCLAPLIKETVVNAQAVHPQRSTPAGRQQWEYTVLSVQRSIDTKDGDAVAGDWTVWYQDTTKLPPPVEIMKKLTQLGQEGWELVGVEPMSEYGTSSLSGETSTTSFSSSSAAGYGGGHSSSPTAASLTGFSMGGTTSAERWIFKRPKL